jgi:hypothetical protein
MLINVVDTRYGGGYNVQNSDNLQQVTFCFYGIIMDTTKRRVYNLGFLIGFLDGSSVKN